jgi:hypothetical protein
MDKTKQTRVAVHNARRMGKKGADAILTIEGVDWARDRNWKAAVRKALLDAGWEVSSLAVAFGRERFDVVATCHRIGESPQAVAAAKVRRSPVTRGGRPIEGTPAPGGRTMRGKARALRGGRS